MDKIKEVIEARNALQCLHLEAPTAVVDNVIMKVEAAFRAIKNQAQPEDSADNKCTRFHEVEAFSGSNFCRECGKRLNG